MISIEEFKARLNADNFDDLVDTVLLADGATHINLEQFDIIQNKIASTYHIAEDEIKVIITGSAKIGFSLIEKRLQDGTVKPRFRRFDIDSDIDVAVLCPRIFNMIWLELSAFAANRSSFPLEHKKLGPYLVSGWLRPDHFPGSNSLINCRKWFPLFADLSADIRLGRRKVRGGLYNSREQLRQYQLRSLRESLSGAEL